jgi:hypothetical protein
MAKRIKFKNPLSPFQLGIACLLVGVVFMIAMRQISVGRQNRVSDFTTCRKAGNPTSESYPKVCIAKDGQSYTEVLEPVTGEYAQVETKRGKVIQFDAHLAGKGVKGQLVIESSPGITHGYYVGNGGSADCDRSLVEMVKSREIKSGDLVEVRSQLAGQKAEPGQAVNSIGFSIVCGEGTFIKKLNT